VGDVEVGALVISMPCRGGGRVSSDTMRDVEAEALAHKPRQSSTCLLIRYQRWFGDKTFADTITCVESEVPVKTEGDSVEQ